MVHARTCRLPFALLLSFASPVPLVAQEAAPAGKQRLTYADVGKAIAWQGPLQARWVAGGPVVAVQEGEAVRWLDARTGEVVAKPPAPAAGAAPGQVALLIDNDVWLDAAPAAAPGRRGPGRARAPQKSASAVQLTKDGAGGARKEEVHLAPGGRAVSFVRGNNLCVVDVGTGAEWAVTTDGGPERFHGLLDWVYQEEIYGRGDFQGHWWSPAGGQLAFLSLDESQVKEFTLVDHVPPGFLDRERAVVPEVSNYPKAGDPNPFASLAIAHLDGRKVVPVDLAAFPKDVLVMRVDWTPDGGTLLVSLQDRIQTWAELCAVDPATGKVTRWIREESPTWVNRTEPPRWLPDGTFLWLSERTGYAHLYRYERGGKLLAAVTAGEWQVRSVERVDAERRLCWFEGTKDGATGRHLYRIGLDGQGLVCLTPGIGTHQAELSADGALVLDRWSAMDQPPVVRVLDGATGEVVRELAAVGRGAALRYEFSERRRLAIPARDGYLLDASLQLPTDFREGQRYPVFLPTYSGPDAPTVRDAWQHSTFHQFLCQQGFVVLQVNVRSASNRGQQHAGACYRQLGVQELRDLEDAVDFVCAQHGGDPARVAISGWSYGGFMAAYALTHSKKFALGLAGAGVYDWRLYDTVYTERFMRTPQENAAGYDATSVIKAAGQLHGHLVLLHGSLDDNVHLQNTMQLLWELQRLGKQNFELMVYPRSRHGLAPQVNAHSQEFQWLRLQRLLEPRQKG